jgi:hypothetical protein
MAIRRKILAIEPCRVSRFVDFYCEQGGVNLPIRLNVMRLDKVQYAAYSNLRKYHM